MNDSNKRNLVMIIVFIVISLIIGIVITTNSSLFKKEDEKVVDESTPIVNDDFVTQELDITDNNIINELKANTDFLSAFNGNSHIIDNLYVDDTISSLSDTNKLLVVLNSLTKNNTTSISYDSVISSYKKIYDVDCDDSFFSSIDGTYRYINDSSNRVFKIDRSYSNPTSIIEYSYDYKYSSEGDNFYLYRSIGYSRVGTKTIYKDYNNNIYKDNTDINSFYIDNSNYIEFSHYRYSFSKNSNGNYYFRDIEKV